MKALIAWLTRRQTCACGGWKPAHADACFDCTNAELDAILHPPAEIIELAERRPGRHAA